MRGTQPRAQLWVKEQEGGSRPARCFLCPVWAFTCSRKHQPPIEQGSLQGLLLRCSGKREKTKESKATSGCQDTCVPCSSRRIKRYFRLSSQFSQGPCFSWKNRSTSGYTLFLCHGIYIDVSQETLQLTVLFAFKGRKPAGCPSLPCARTGGQR